MKDVGGGQFTWMTVDGSVGGFRTGKRHHLLENGDGAPEQAARLQAKVDAYLAAAKSPWGAAPTEVELDESFCRTLGERFPEEARRIHYGESDPRGIYGESSDEDAKALEDEGIAFRRIPWLPRENS